MDTPGAEPRITFHGLWHILALARIVTLSQKEKPMSANLVVMLAAASEAFPVTQSVVRILSADGRVLYEEYLGTESEGKTRPFSLQTPDDAQTLEPTQGDPPPYASYVVTVRSEHYYLIRIEGVQMFSGFGSTLPIQMIPLPVDGIVPENYPPLVYRVGENALNQALPRAEAPEEASLPVPEAVPTLLESVYIPSRIRVHLGTPDSNAQTVSTSFPDYIKNVACSEIYPTWPEESLRANIHAQISLALNRIYTEWYPSRGYNFDITNSTAFDQYYVYGRNIFDNVARLVDEIFNVYVRRPNRVEPFYAEYCNGSSVSCAGMSQWGTVSLAQQGLSAREILSFYYGDVELVSTSDVRDVEQSYPGVPLREGSSGADVRTVQEQLNRVAINYPSIGLTSVDGVYGPSTRRAVTNFQRLFVLDPDGVVGKETWYRLSYLYTAVKKLAELTSEGQREEYNTTEYPGFMLRRGSKGSEVQQIQFYLSRIAAFNPSVPSVGIDGIYGLGTQNAVQEFQRYYGLSPDGIVGRQTWNRIVDVYVGTTDSESPDAPLSPRPYPGTVLKTGSRGEDVRYVQQLLNLSAATFRTLPRVAADGDFGSLTRNAVLAFQRLFGLSADGAVGRDTWNRLNDAYNAVETGCLFASPPLSDEQSYPGYVLYIGSAGTKVTYVQQRINRIASALPGIGRVSEDSRFGRNTYNAVKNLQSLFGLSPDGSVGQDTWELLNRLSRAVASGCLPGAAREAMAEPTSAQAASPVFSFRSRPLSLGAFGKDVAAFKDLLREKTGASLGEGLLYGNRTAAAVSRFQKERGLPVTGRADEATVLALQEGK